MTGKRADGYAKPRTEAKGASNKAFNSLSRLNFRNNRIYWSDSEAWCLRLTAAILSYLLEAV